MMLDRRCDHNRIKAHTIEHMIKIRQALDVRIQAPHVLEACVADIAHRFQMAVGQPLEVAHKIGAPISATDYTYYNWFFHMCTIGSRDVSNLLFTLLG